MKKLSIDEHIECIADPNHKGWRTVIDNLIEFYPIARLLEKQAKINPPIVYYDPKAPPGQGVFSGVENVLTAPTYLIGGPTPFSLSLIGAIYGTLIGKAIGMAIPITHPTIADYIYLERIPYITAVLGAIPGIWLGGARAFGAKSVSDAIMGFFKKAPRSKEELEKEAQIISNFSTNSVIDEAHWRDIVLSDPFLKEKEKVLATAPILAAGIANNSRLVTPFDVAKVTLNAGLGALYGLGLSSIASAILGLSPKGRAAAQKLGLISGLVKGLVQGL